MTADERAYCENWCKAHVKTWQVLNRSQWQYTFHPKALVRYVEEVHQTEDQIRLILEYLVSDECIATLSLYDQGVSGSWKPIRAWLETSNKAVQGVRSVRLYHGLQWVLAHEDSWYVVEDSCSQKVSVKYYWNASDVVDVTGMSSSGVTVRIAGLQRDPETGFFNYMLEKIERKQQDLPEYVSAITVYENVLEEQHLGVKAGASAGKQASAGDGRIVRRKESKNADCTHNVENTTVEEKTVAGASETISVSLTGKTVVIVNRNMPEKASDANLDIGESVENTKTDGGRWNQVIRKVARYFIHLGDSCRKTIYAHTHSTSDVQGTNPGFTHVEEAGGGIVREKDVSRTSDGGYKIDARTVAEQPVTGASVGYHRTLKGTVRTQVDRSQQNPVTGGGMRIGETRRSEKTEGGLWNNTNEVFDGTPAGKIGEACERSELEHTHALTTNVADEPTVEAGVTGVNRRRAVSAQRTEVDTWDKTVRDTEFFPKKVTTTGGSAGASTTIVIGLNQPDVPSGGAGGVNEVRRVSAQPNDHGSYSTHEETVVYKPLSATANGGSELAQKRIRVEKNATSSDAGESPGVNKSVEASITPNDHGSYDKHVVITDFKSDSATVNVGSVGATRRLTVEKNATSRTIGASPSVNQDVHGSITINDHGSCDKHYEVIVYKPLSATANGGSTSVSSRVIVNKNATDSNVNETPATNRTVEASVVPNDHGSYDKHVVVRDYHKASGRATSERATGKLVTEVTINDPNGNPVGWSASAHPNEHGSFTTHVSTYTPKKIDTGWITWDSVTLTETSKLTYEYGIRIFENLTSVPHPVNNAQCGVTARVNEDGLFCGHLSYSRLKTWDRNTAGIESDGKKYWMALGNVYKSELDGKQYQTWRQYNALYVSGGLSASQMASYSENCEKVGRIGNFYTFIQVIQEKDVELGKKPY